MKVAIGVNSNGLGHATRCYPLIKACLDKGHEVHVISSGRSLKFLKQEFNNQVYYHSIKDYTLSKDLFTKSWSLTAMFTFLPKLLYQIYREHKAFLRLHKRVQFDRIISDTRSGIYADVPSYIIYHLIRTPVFPKSERLSEAVFLLLTIPFKKILIPDTRTSELAGEYTKNFSFLKQYEYIGVLSMMQKQKVKKDIDYYFSISGPEPQRTYFERKVMQLLPTLKGKVVITLGKPEHNWKHTKHGATVYAYTTREQQEEFFNRSKLIVTRSGYTTILDLAQIDGHAACIPTDNQPEQEYLATLHDKEQRTKRILLKDLSVETLEQAKKYSGFNIKSKTKQAVDNFMKIVDL